MENAVGGSVVLGNSSIPKKLLHVDIQTTTLSVKSTYFDSKLMSRRNFSINLCYSM